MKKRIKILHITNWYPDANNPATGTFIKEHIDALNNKSQNVVIHLQVEYKSTSILHIESKSLSSYETRFTVYSFLRQWFFIEIITCLAFVYLINKHKANQKFDAINIHIAYPILTYLHIIKYLIKVPIVVTEHWSAYHFNFGLSSNTDKLNRIKKIFYNNFKLITVSEALAYDIKEFSGNHNLNFKVVPNVVKIHASEDYSLAKNYNNSKLVFFCLAYWKDVKNPFILFEAFKEICKERPKSILKIGGYGPLIPKMKQAVEALKIENNVQFLGYLSKERVITEMKNISAFLHASYYETFSVVCAEALCCGTPVLASYIPAIAEYLNEANGILVPENNTGSWLEAMNEFISKEDKYDRENIAMNAVNKFSAEAVSEKYLQVIKETLTEFYDKRN